MRSHENRELTQRERERQRDMRERKIEMFLFGANFEKFETKFAL